MPWTSVNQCKAWKEEAVGLNITSGTYEARDPVVHFSKPAFSNLPNCSSHREDTP